MPRDIYYENGDMTGWTANFDHKTNMWKWLKPEPKPGEQLKFEWGKKCQKIKTTDIWK